MKNCTDCKYGKFDEHWGDYKCKMRQHRVQPDKYHNCQYWKKKEKEEKQQF